MSGSIASMIQHSQSGSPTTSTGQMPSGGASAPQPRFPNSLPTNAPIQSLPPQMMPQGNGGISALGGYTHNAMPLPQGGGFFGANIQPAQSAANSNFALSANSAVPGQAQRDAVLSGVPNSMQSTLAGLGALYGANLAGRNV